MKYVRIFILTFQQVLEQRGRVFVWFLISIVNPLMILIFWRGISSGGAVIPGWTLPTITSYYIFLTMADSFLVSHTEEDVSREDIQKGDLAIHLLRPFPYYWRKFLQEFPYRVVQGLFAIVAGSILILFFGSFTISHTWYILLFAVVLAFAGHMISFTFKMILGLCALWFTEMDGVYQFFIIINLVVGGYIVPLYLLPTWLSTIAYLLPFSYVVYFPVIAFQGKLSPLEMLFVLAAQLAWIAAFGILYRFVWKNGLKKFTAVGR